METNCKLICNVLPNERFRMVDDNDQTVVHDQIWQWNGKKVRTNGKFRLMCVQVNGDLIDFLEPWRQVYVLPATEATEATEEIVRGKSEMMAELNCRIREQLIQSEDVTVAEAITILQQIARELEDIATATISASDAVNNYRLDIHGNVITK